MWLSPLSLSGDVKVGKPSIATESKAMSSHRTPKRASHKGYLPMSLAESLQLLEWTGRNLRHDKRGTIPSHVAPSLQRLKITDDGWLKLVKDFRRLFHRAAGSPATITNEATRWGHHWLKGIRQSRAMFA